MKIVSANFEFLDFQILRPTQRSLLWTFLYMLINKTYNKKYKNKVMARYLSKTLGNSAKLGGE